MPRVRSAAALAALCLTAGFTAGTAPAAQRAAAAAPCLRAARVRGEDAGRTLDRGDVPAALVPLIEARTDRILRGLRLREDPVTIPVYVHVIHDGADGNVSDAQIRKQIATLNAAYGGKVTWHGEHGANTGFSFKLMGRDRTDNATWFSSPDDSEMQFTTRLRRGGPGTLNLYTADLGQEVLGWSSFPWLRAGIHDDVVVHYGTLPGGGAHAIPDYGLGMSAVHETGHWLGLYHPFQGWDSSTGTGGCSGPGDEVADTPSEDRPSEGCPVGKNTCALRPGTDPVHNFMDYSYDSCMDQFTPGQAARMHRFWTAYRT